MRLLLDQNLSHRLKAPLAGVYSDVAHVREFALERADDTSVWDFAKANGFAIVSKDSQSSVVASFLQDATASLLSLSRSGD